MKYQTKRMLMGYVYISPWIIGFLVLMVFPLVYSLKLSFEEFNLLTSPSFVGLENYVNIFTEDSDFIKALSVTSIYSIWSIPLKTIAALLLALLLNNKLKGMRWFRVVYFLPGVLAGTAVALMWKHLFATENGLINTILSWFGIQGPSWLWDPNYVMSVFITISVWNVGSMVIIYLTALQGVPAQLYESAAIDGAGRLRTFFTITVPMITPVIFFNVVMNIISSFQVFTEGYVIFSATSQNMPLGGPENSALFYVIYLYQQAFSYLNMGYASALAWILFVIILIFSFLVIKSSPLWVYYQSDDK